MNSCIRRVKKKKKKKKRSGTTNIKMDELGGSRGSVRSPGYKFVSRLAASMKKGEGRRPPPLFSYFVLEVSAGNLHVWAEGEGSVESRASRNDFETSRQPIRPQ